MPIHVTFNAIDTNLLRKQLHCLYRLQPDQRSSKDKNLIEGVINLLEHIQGQIDPPSVSITVNPAKEG